MGAVRPCEVVEPLPLPQLGLEIDVALVADELVELLLIRPVRPLNLAVELRQARLDVGVPNTAPPSYVRSVHPKSAVSQLERTRSAQRVPSDSLAERNSPPKGVRFEAA